MKTNYFTLQKWINYVVVIVAAAADIKKVEQAVDETRSDATI